MNVYTQAIADLLNIELDEALKIQNFIDDWFDIRYSSITGSKLKKVALEAREMMSQPQFAFADSENEE